MARSLSLLVLAALSPLLHAQVLINEVLFYNDPSNTQPILTHQWLELVNTSSDPVDLTGWFVTANDGVNGPGARPLPSLLLPAGAYLVVHFTGGSNQLDFTNSNYGDYYTGDDSANTPYWMVDGDEAGLYSPNGIVDFINWARSTVPYVRGQAHLDAVAASIWSLGSVMLHDAIGADLAEVLRILDPGDSIGRDPDSTDTNTVHDFNGHGGGAAMGPTPGAQNLSDVPMDPPAPDSGGQPLDRREQGAPLKTKPWTILLYMNADNNLESWFVQKVCRLQQAGGTTANINLVVMLDLKNLTDPVTHRTTTYRGLLNPPAFTKDCNARIGNGQNATAPLTLISPGLTDMGEQDMGNPDVLKSFVAWGKQNYPALHYGLILSSHGAGWKGFGPDETFPSGTRQKVDSLYMGELSDALDGQHFDWIVFDACLMGSVEVAHQLRFYTDYLLASEEVTWTDDFPYEQMAIHMNANPGWTGKQAITDVFNEYVKRVKAVDANGHAVKRNYTISVIDESKVFALSQAVGAWASVLAPGMSLFFGRNNASDNAQILTQEVRDATGTFTDKNYIDLYDFAQRMLNKGLPDCMMAPANDVKTTFKQAVMLESHGASHDPVDTFGNRQTNAYGLHIYFPARRMVRVDVLLVVDQGRVVDELLLKKANGTTLLHYQHDYWDQPYDLPNTRATDGSSSFVHYGENRDRLPLKARDPETGIDLAAGVWPTPQSPGFLFPNDTGWFNVLDRFYHPVADANIQPVPGGVITQTGGGDCKNPMDSITVPLGTTVTISGAGSSDADQATGTTKPTHWFWDLDDQVGCAANCVSPFTVTPPGTEAATANTNMDADRDLKNVNQKDLDDQRDRDLESVTRVCDRVSPPIVVTLIPWDDDDSFPFHNTRKDANYVHTQSGYHRAILNCVNPVTLFPMGGTINATFTVKSDPYISAPYLVIDGFPITVNFSTLAGNPGAVPGPAGTAAATATTITVTSQQPAIPTATGAYDPTTGKWSATGMGTIAGFRNVEVKWTNMVFGGPGNNTLTGTYQVGTNGNLNNEDQPVTYTVTGTVTRK